MSKKASTPSFDDKELMTDEEKVAEHKLVGSLMAAEQRMGFTG